MLTLSDCIELSGLTEEQILMIAEHEHLPEMAAAELGHYLCQSQDGEFCIKGMIRDHIERAASAGDALGEVALKLALRNFILQHPRCDSRLREALRLPERRASG